MPLEEYLGRQGSRVGTFRLPTLMAIQAGCVQYFNQLRQTFSNYGLGIIYLFAVIVLWTTSNFITQDLYTAGYNKPFLVTYLNTTSFTFYLLPFAFKKYLSKDLHLLQHSSSPAYEVISSDTDDNAQHNGEECPTSPHTALTGHETARLAVQFWLLWFLANWSLNASLEFTSVASSTVLASTSGFCTLLVTWIFGMENVYLLKVVAILTSFIGVALVANSDRTQASMMVPGFVHDASNPLLGDVLALSSAIFYALYITLLKVRIREESRINMPLFFGFVGLFNIFLALPVYAVLQFSGIESMEWPDAPKAWITIIANMLITLSSDYLYVLSMLKTTPLVVTVGISLTIPLALVGDYFLASHPSIQAIIGACLVLTSFVAIGLANATAGGS